MNPNGHHAMNGYRANNLASTSSQNYNDFIPVNSTQSPYNNTVQQQQQRQPQHSGQSMQQRNHVNQWSQLAMQMNDQLNNPQMNSPQINPPHMNNTPPLSIPHAQQNQLPFNQTTWGNQMLPPQRFPTGIAPMTFNMPFLPQQILQDAYAMSTPVEAADEPFLLTKLLTSRRKNESYKDALNSLHGKNGHSASLWKDYYLDHKERIDGWIAMCLQKEKEDKAGVANGGLKRSTSSDLDRVKKATAKKPSPASFKREPSPHVPSSSRVSISAPPVKRTHKKSSKSATPIPMEPPQSSRRNTINSLTAPEPVYGDRLPAPNAEIKIPEPPSRSPSPPTNVIPQGRGNKYTKEDRDFFIKFVGWRLKQDPELTRQEICNLLAERAPHHTFQSWASHWSNNHDLPDKILAAARGDEDIPANEASSDEEAAKVSARRKPKYKDSTTSAEEDSESEKDSDDGNEEEEEEVMDESAHLRQYTEKEMGQRGEPFTNADLYITAKYIATFPNWDKAPSKDRWEPHSSKFPQRSGKSWAEYYRRNEDTILKTVKRLKKEASSPSQVASSIRTQCARPTRTPPKAKRKFEFDASDDTLVKRGRT